MKQCYFRDHLLEVTADIILHLTSISAVYRVYSRAHDVHHFAKYRSLPPKHIVERNIAFVYVAYVFNIIMSILCLSFNIIWTYTSPHPIKLHNYVRVVRMISIMFVSLCSILFALSLWLLVKTKSVTTGASWSKQMATV